MYADNRNFFRCITTWAGGLHYKYKKVNTYLYAKKIFIVLNFKINTICFIFSFYMFVHMPECTYTHTYIQKPSKYKIRIPWVLNYNVVPGK